MTTPDEHAVGDYITFRLAGWSESSFANGRIVGVCEWTDRILVIHDGQEMEIDPRPWPAGNVLPF